MMKLSEKTKNFILYGVENKIERKEIYKFDGAILFLCFLAMFIADWFRQDLCAKLFAGSG